MEREFKITKTDGQKLQCCSRNNALLMLSKRWIFWAKLCLILILRHTPVGELYSLSTALCFSVSFCSLLHEGTWELILQGEMLMCLPRESVFFNHYLKLLLLFLKLWWEVGDEATMCATQQTTIYHIDQNSQLEVVKFWLLIIVQYGVG